MVTLLLGTFQLGRAKDVGQQLSEGRHDVILLAFGHDYSQPRAAELIECLTADAAGAGDKGVLLPRLAAHNGDSVKLAHTLADSLEQSRALGAVRCPIGAVFNIAAAIDRAVGQQQRRPNLIAGVGRVGVPHGLHRSGNQSLCIHYFSSSLAKLFPGVSKGTSSSSATVAAMSAKEARVPREPGRT